jgi:hypothetical protein
MPTRSSSLLSSVPRLLEGVIVATVSIVVVCATLATTLAG